MPWPANSLATLEPCDITAHSSNLADDLVARHYGPRVREVTGLLEPVAAAYSTGEDFDENLARAGLLQLNVLDRERGIGLLEDGGLVGLGE